MGDFTGAPRRPRARLASGCSPYAVCGHRSTLILHRLLRLGCVLTSSPISTPRDREIFLDTGRSKGTCAHRTAEADRGLRATGGRVVEVQDTFLYSNASVAGGEHRLRARALVSQRADCATARRRGPGGGLHAPNCPQGVHYAVEESWWLTAECGFRERQRSRLARNPMRKPRAASLR